MAKPALSFSVPLLPRLGLGGGREGGPKWGFHSSSSFFLAPSSLDLAGGRVGPQVASPSPSPFPLPITNPGLLLLRGAFPPDARAPATYGGRSFFVRTRTEPHTGPGISEGGREGPSPLCSSRKRWQKNSIQRQETPIPMTQASVQVTIAVVRRDSRCIKAPFLHKCTKNITVEKTTGNEDIFVSIT